MAIAKNPSVVTHQVRIIDLVVLGLVAAYIPLHAAAWTAYPTDTDPADFFLALDDYNISQDRPHPPGYPAYVYCARALVPLVGHAHAYQLLNLLLVLIAVVTLYAVFRRAGQAAAGASLIAVTMTHPLVWAATVIPESYVSDLTFSVLIFASVYFSGRRGELLFATVFIVFLACGMFRAVSCVMLMPLALVTTFLADKANWKRRFLLALSAAVSGTFLAYILTILLAGGLETYRAAALRVMGTAFSSSSVLGGAPIASHLHMLSSYLVWLLAIALPPPLLLRAASALLGGPRSAAFALNVIGKAQLVAWIVPSFLFYALIYYIKPSYHLVYLVPVMSIAVGMAVRGALGRPLLLVTAIATIVGMQTVFFFCGGSELPAPLYRLTHSYFNDQDDRMKRVMIAYGKLAPEDMLVWIQAPSFSPFQISRLIVGDNVIAVYYPGSRDTSFWHPYTYRLESNWSSIMRGHDKVARIMLVLSGPTGLYISLHEVPGTAKSVADLKKFIGSTAGLVVAHVAK